jgi:hypothetical protein
MLFAFLAATVICLPAQIVDTSVCDILANPQSFDGKIIRIKGTVQAGFEEFIVKNPSCPQPVNAIWLAYPEGTKGKSGPAAFVQIQLAHNNSAPGLSAARSRIKLDKDKTFKQFDSLLSTPYKGGGICLGCVGYTVSATLVGRLDGTEQPGIVRDSKGNFIRVNGFGNMNRYSSRLVLQSVSDVTPHEIDYANIAVAPQRDLTQAGGDPISAAHRVALAFPPGSLQAKQLEVAVAAYGKPGEDNGVDIAFGIPNTVPKDDGVKGKGDSPDGLLFNCTFDMDRLKGNALTLSLSHIGTHIADMRAGMWNATPHDMENRAWQTTVLSALGTGQQALMLPGGYLIWNSAWKPENRSQMADGALSNFLENWTPFSK